MLASGCSQTMPALVDAQLLCKDWRVIRPSRADIDKMSEKLAAEILANNESRPVWGCAKLENKAA